VADPASLPHLLRLGLLDLAPPPSRQRRRLGPDQDAFHRRALLVDFCNRINP
jgi:hypothetical protein